MTASFSVQPAFVTNICVILTIQKANYILSDLIFLMTVLVFAYLAGLMVHARCQDASSEEAKMPRCLSGHLGVLVGIERPWVKPQEISNLTKNPIRYAKTNYTQEG